MALTIAWDGACRTWPGELRDDGLAGGDGSPSSTNWTSTVTVSAVGSEVFYCEIHGGPNGQGMAGTLNVTLPVELQSFEVD